jgi:Glycosyl hydrolase family 26
MAIARRQFLNSVVLVALAAGAAACTRKPQQSSPTESGQAPMGGSCGVTGASCIGAANGEFGAWRSSPVRIAATWAHDGAVTLLQSGGEYGDWPGHVDFAPQFLGDQTTFSWSDCAAGVYDPKFISGLEQLKAVWASRAGNLYYRFQHEFNGTWFPWSVGPEETDNFIAGWRHFAEIFRGVFGADPRYHLVWCVSTGLPTTGFDDIRSLYPGDEHVDVISLDYFDFFTADTERDWDEHAYSLDAGGGPVGIGAWLDFAENHGKPVCISEWANQYGDNPLYIAKMHAFIRDHADQATGSSAGRMIYDIYFNQLLGEGTVFTDGDFRVQIDGADHPQRPNAAKAYRELWAAWAANCRPAQ